MIEPSAAVCGSPPRAWGGRLASGRRGGDGRFTPTGVGRTSRMRSAGRMAVRFTPTGVGRTPREEETCPRLPVHPHGRGEDDFLPDAERVGVRFTPTGVGRTR